MKRHIYLAILAVAFLLPIALAAGFSAFGPPPYVLGGAIGGDWVEPRSFSDGSQVTVEDAGSPEAARAAANDLLQTIPIFESGTLPGITRYRTETTSISGAVLPLDRFVIHIEAPDEATREARLESLPFIAENPNRNPVFVAMTEHTDWVAPGIFAYCIAWCLFMARGGAWALRREPDEGVRPATASELKSRLMGLDRMHQPFTISQIGENRFRVDPRVTDIGWVQKMHLVGLRKAHRIELDLDEKTHTVRVVEKTHRVKWGEGLIPFSGRFAFFRAVTMDPRDLSAKAGVTYDPRKGWQKIEGHEHRFTPGEAKTPLAQAVLASGWTWQPAFSFGRVLSG